MQTPRQVPPIGRGPQSFAKETRSPIQSPMMMGQMPMPPIPQQPSPEASIAECLQDLSMEIYARLAVNYISDSQATFDPEALRSLAQTSQTAAKAYFESLGVQFHAQS